VAVFSQPCPELAGLIEQGAPREALAAAVAGHVKAVTARIGRSPDRAILGCTHYEIVADLFRAALPPGAPLIHQPQATAEALARYLERRPEFDPGHGAVRRFLTTGRPGAQSSLVEAFWGKPLSFERA
jgi:glutamate racemase